MIRNIIIHLLEKVLNWLNAKDLHKEANGIKDEQSSENKFDKQTRLIELYDEDNVSDVEEFKELLNGIIGITKNGPIEISKDEPVPLERLEYNEHMFYPNDLYYLNNSVMTITPTLPVMIYLPYFKDCVLDGGISRYYKILSGDDNKEQDATFRTMFLSQLFENNPIFMLVISDQTFKNTVDLIITIIARGVNPKKHIWEVYSNVTLKRYNVIKQTLYNVICADLYLMLVFRARWDIINVDYDALVTHMDNKLNSRYGMAE